MTTAITFLYVDVSVLCAMCAVLHP